MKSLSIKQIKIARQHALKNADNLVKEAEALFNIGSYPRVVFLSHIAGEEIAKHIMLTSTLVKLIAGKNINWKKFWKRLTSHKEKLELILFMEDTYFDKPFPDNLEEYFEDLREQAKKIDYFKQMSLYCDFAEEIALSPSELIDKETAKNALGWAKGRIRFFTTMENEFQKREILDKLTENTIKEFVKKLKSDTWFVGGASLLNEFLKNGLVDEFIITIFPLLLGEGIPLFRDDGYEKNLSLIDVKSYDSGVVQLSYQTKV